MTTHAPHMIWQTQSEWIYHCNHVASYVRSVLNTTTLQPNWKITRIFILNFTFCLHVFQIQHSIQHPSAWNNSSGYNSPDRPSNPDRNSSYDVGLLDDRFVVGVCDPFLSCHHNAFHRQKLWAESAIIKLHCLPRSSYRSRRQGLVRKNVAALFSARQSDQTNDWQRTIRVERDKSSVLQLVPGWLRLEIGQEMWQRHRYWSANRHERGWRRVLTTAPTSLELWPQLATRSEGRVGFNYRIGNVRCKRRPRQDGGTFEFDQAVGRRVRMASVERSDDAVGNDSERIDISFEDAEVRDDGAASGQLGTFSRDERTSDLLHWTWTFGSIRTGSSIGARRRSAGPGGSQDDDCLCRLSYRQRAANGAFEDDNQRQSTALPASRDSVSAEHWKETCSDLLWKRRLPPSVRSRSTFQVGLDRQR